MRQWGFVFIFSMLSMMLCSCIEKTTMVDISRAFADDHLVMTPTVSDFENLYETLEAHGCHTCLVKTFMYIYGQSHSCTTLVIEFQSIKDASTYYNIYKNEIDEALKVYEHIRRRDQIIILSTSENAMNLALGNSR